MFRSGKRDPWLLVLMLVVVGLLGLLILQGSGIWVASNAVKARRTLPESARQALQAFDKLPLYFIENRGQIDDRVAYYVHGRDTSVYFTKQGVTFALTGREGVAPEARLQPVSWRRPVATAEAPQRWAVKLDFVGANPSVKLQGEGRTSTAVSYFNGRPDKWKTGLSTHSSVVYRGLWPGIDLEYSGKVDRLKYQFVVQPGASVEQIRLAYRGITGLRVAERGELAVSTLAGGFRDQKPCAHQELDGRRVEVAAVYSLVGGSHEYGFEVGSYDRSRPLVVDPSILAYVGYIGGAGDDRGQGVAVDGSGNAYITGFTTSLARFPATVGPDLTFNGGFDAFVTKVNAAGTALIYAGVIGGSGWDLGSGIAVDVSGNAYVTGHTTSPEASFPVMGGPDPTFNGGFDAFVAKVNATGTALVYAGYIGGSGDDLGRGIAVDGSGNAYVTGVTSSSERSFPVLVGPDRTFNGIEDAFVTKVNTAGTALVYSGYIGGSAGDSGSGIALDVSENAYVAGVTRSSETSFPVLMGPDLTFNGAYDGFAAKVNAAGTALVYGGYIGGLGGDEGYSIAVDGSGHAYITGATASSEASFPVAVGPDLTHNGGLIDAFVAKVNAAGTALIYAGYIGGSGDDRGAGVAADASGNAYVTGVTASTEASFPVAVGPVLNHSGGTIDAFVAKVNAAGTALAYSGYIGGSGADVGGGIAVDGLGNAYVTGYTLSSEANFPVLGGHLTFYGAVDAFVAKIRTATLPPRSRRMQAPLRD